MTDLMHDEDMNEYERRELQIGDILFNKGDQADEAYLIEDGQLKIFEKAGDQIVNYAWVEPGEIIGEMALMINTTRTASAMATKNSVVIPITTEQLQKKLINADPVMRKLLLASLNRLKKMNERIAALHNQSRP